MNGIDAELTTDEDEPMPPSPVCPICHSISTIDVDEENDAVKWECCDCGFSWWEEYP